jgi:hypothetical protein
MELTDMKLKYLIYPAGEDRLKKNIPVISGNSECPIPKRQDKKRKIQLLIKLRRISRCN